MWLVLPSVSSLWHWWQHPVHTCRADDAQGLTRADDPTWKLGNWPWSVSQSISPQGVVWFLCFIGFWFAWYSLRCLFFPFFFFSFYIIFCKTCYKCGKQVQKTVTFTPGHPKLLCSHFIKAGAPWNLWDLSEAFEAEYRVVSSPSLLFMVVGMFHLYHRFFYYWCAPLFLNVNLCANVQIQCSCYRLNKFLFWRWNTCT